MNTGTLNPDVSFPKDVFIQDDFNVDRFLQEYCSKSGLHKLHKELGIFIKYLQMVMIDIVNAESSAIVNLSSDLKVLQNKFTNISTPLGQFKEEVSQIYKIIDVNLNSIKHLLEQKEKTSGVKSSKINELRILISSQKISKILVSHLEDNTIDMEVLERSVDQYILQQMYCQNCNFTDFKTQITHSTDVLNQILNNVFLKSILQKNVDHIVRCLQMYMLMNTQSAAEQLYATKVVRPALYKVINEETLKLCRGNLEEIYSRIINFINSDMKLLLNIVNKSNGISGFNFILNSAWLEIHEQLKLNMSSIYAPGNPAVFHQRYTQTCKFLAEFERCFLDDKQRIEFLQHPSYAAHKLQWNLPVYYEIRHLEIVHSLEQHFSDNISSVLFNKEAGQFKLVPSSNVWFSLQRCFNPDIYLPQLLDRFWKLNLQIISRFATWIQQLLNKNMPIKEDTPPGDLDNTNASLNDLKLKFLTYLYYDITKFLNKLNQPFATTGLQFLCVVPKNLHDIFKRSLIDPQNQLQKILSSIENVIVNSVYTDCSIHVKQISQIPRLFRKTNRNTPSGPSAYVSSMSKPIHHFYQSYKGDLDEEVTRRILCAIHMKIIAEYKMLVENVLTSVTKTEESLRRLKKIRSSNGTSETTAITDDQKIRLQVQLDITHYSKEAQQFADSSRVNELLLLIKETDQGDSK